MPTYPFHCPGCGRDVEVVRPMSRAGDAEVCPDCAGVMDRVFTVPQFSMSIPFTGYFDRSLGIQVNKKSDITEYQKWYTDKTGGSELVEVGNERVERHVRPAVKEYSVPGAALDGMFNG